MTSKPESKEERLARLQTELLALLGRSAGIRFLAFLDNDGVRELWAKAAQHATKPSSSIREDASPEELEAWYGLQWSELEAASEVLVSVGGYAALPWAKIQLLDDFAAGKWLVQMREVILLSTDRKRAIALFDEEHQYESFFLRLDCD